MAFGKEVAVNIADVERFRQSVNHFSLQTSSSLRKMEETLKFMIDHSKRRAQELKTLAQKFYGIEKIQAVRAMNLDVEMITPEELLTKATISVVE